MNRRTRAATYLVVLLGFGPLIISCGAGSTSTGEGPGVDITVAAAGEDAVEPLTGLPVPDGGSAVSRRPVLVLKMDNTASSDPQRGLGRADLVVEELVEGGITRLAAFYYSQVPGKVGPVRSMRASDIGIVGPVDATLVTSGAAAVTIERLRDAGVHYVTEGSPGFYRDDTRTAPYNLMTTLTDVARATRQPAARPPDYLPWGRGPDVATAPVATTLAATFAGGRTTDWSYRDGHYVNTDSYAAPGDTFAADNVLVLRVRVRDAGYLDPAGNHVPETDLTGGGAALLFHGGHVVSARWHKDSLTSALTLSDGPGDDAGPVTVPPGHTWIELVPTDDGKVVYGR